MNATDAVEAARERFVLARKKYEKARIEHADAERRMTEAFAEAQQAHEDYLMARAE